MKHQYESEILFRLMERDGFNIPSSVPPYESEIKTYLIEQVMLAYPKLTDYESEWLLYNYTKHIPAEFPLETITDVTNATVNNVVPYGYKSAILKGNTLVNLLKNAYISDGVIRNSGVSYSKADTTYTLIYNVTTLPSTTERSSFMIELSNGKTIYQNTAPTVIHNMGVNKWVFKVPSDATFSTIGYWSKSEDVKLCANNIVLLEGDYTQENIPYFEGMQSVKMPVLKTTGKNLFDIEKFYENVIKSLHTVSKSDIGITVGNPVYTNGKILLSFGNGVDKRYRTSFKTTNSQGIVLGYRYTDGTDSVIWGNGSGSISAEGKIVKNIFMTYATVVESTINDIIIEEYIGNAHTYEPYKTNILSSSEEVVLRGIGDVQDTLNCLTGELVQSVGVLNGEEVGWQQERHSQAPTDLSLIAFSIDLIKSPNKNLLSSVLVESGDVNKPYRWYISFNTWLVITLPKSEVTNLDEFKAWLKNNEVLYPLTEKSIKTVDLSVVDENGNEINYFMPIEGTMHIQTDGEPIKPSVTMEIPVEATTQNLASFIEMEE